MTKIVRKPFGIFKSVCFVRLLTSKRQKLSRVPTEILFDTAHVQRNEGRHWLWRKCKLKDEANTAFHCMFIRYSNSFMSHLTISFVFSFHCRIYTSVLMWRSTTSSLFWLTRMNMPWITWKNTPQTFPRPTFNLFFQNWSEFWSKNTKKLKPTSSNTILVTREESLAIFSGELQSV